MEQQPEPQQGPGETTRSGTTPSAAAAASPVLADGGETQEDIPLTAPPPPPCSTCCSPGKQQQPQQQASNNNSNKVKPRRSWSQPALQRRRKLQDAQRRAADRLLHPQHPRDDDDDGKNGRRRHRGRAALQRGWRAAARAVNKVNVARWIGDLERDQELADQLERRNVEHAAESERRLLVARVRAECLAAVRAHLESFLRERGGPGATYEEWIGEVHPDNVVVEEPPSGEDSDSDNNNNNNTAGGPVVDARFYVPDSDHRILWNEHHPRTGDGASRRVPARAVVLEPEGTAGNNGSSNNSNSNSTLSPFPTPTTKNASDNDADDNNVTSSEDVQHHPTSNPKRTDPVIQLV